MDHGPAERYHPLDGLRDVRHDEVGQAEGIPWSTAALVDAYGRSLGMGLPTPTLGGPSRIELHPEKLAPEVTSTYGVVGGKLDQGERWVGH